MCETRSSPRTSSTAAAPTARHKGPASWRCTVRTGHSIARAAPGHNMICSPLVSLAARADYARVGARKRCCLRQIFGTCCSRKGGGLGGGPITPATGTTTATGQTVPVGPPSARPPSLISSGPLWCAPPHVQFVPHGTCDIMQHFVAMPCEPSPSFVPVSDLRWMCASGLKCRGSRGDVIGKGDAVKCCGGLWLACTVVLDDVCRCSLKWDTFCGGQPRQTPGVPLNRY